MSQLSVSLIRSPHLQATCADGCARYMHQVGEVCRECCESLFVVIISCYGEFLVDPVDLSLASVYISTDSNPIGFSLGKVLIF